MAPMKRRSQYRRRSWTIEWVVYIPGQGHCLTQYTDGQAVWLAGVKQ